MTESTNTKRKMQRRFKGVVVSDKMNKTIVVRVDRTAIHPKYGKRYVQSRNYHVHDEQNICQKDDVVIFVETSPISLKKKWRLFQKVSPSVKNLTEKED